jgi:DivIVA domain-containing protein
MFISPSEVQEQELKRRLRGYNRASVEALLQNVVSSYEWVWRERDQLKAQVEQLQKELAPLRKAEDQLRDILVTAERAASEVRAQAAQDADALLEQARAKSKAQENAAAEVRAQAARDAEALLEQARAKAKASQSAMKAQQTRLKNEVERLKTLEQELHANLRSFLRSGLQLIEDRNETKPSPAADATQKSPAADATQKSPVADATQKSPVAPLAPSTHKTPDPTTA